MKISVNLNSCGHNERVKTLKNVSLLRISNATSTKDTIRNAGHASGDYLRKMANYQPWMMIKLMDLNWNLLQNLPLCTATPPVEPLDLACGTSCGTTLASGTALKTALKF